MWGHHGNFFFFLFFFTLKKKNMLRFGYYAHCNVRRQMCDVVLDVGDFLPTGECIVSCQILSMC